MARLSLRPTSRRDPGLGSYSAGCGESASPGSALLLVLALLVRGGATYDLIPPVNAWLTLAQSAINTTAFCLPHVPAVGALMETCFVGVCTELQVLQQHTWLSRIPKDIPHAELYALGPGAAVDKLDASMYSFRLANVTAAITCMNFVNAKHVAVNHDNVELVCRHKRDVSFAYGHMKLPLGWFLLCGRTAFTYVPANSSGGPCAIGRVAPLLFPHPSVRGPRQRRDSIPLSPTCKADVTLFSEQEAAALAFTLVGIPGLVVHNYHAVAHLACTVAKALNLTSTVLALLTQEMGEVRRGVLQNRLAIDYLLLRHGHPCSDFVGMCCFNITDASAAIEKDLDRLRHLAEGIRQHQGDFWLWSWLSSLRGWAAHLLQGLMLGMLCIFVACLLYFCYGCARRCCCVARTLAGPSWPLGPLALPGGRM
ncbi:uncharacterized protein LOC120388904 [Mauremys reevesii]|uniref:uncharacterized protein LOC120388904 n=1 Tax=Mauremys reevesii TaxID=260615 RepID=UPI00193FA9CB|nr:uncharacterized protein LOC120388904 [Mauremys reevesii]